MTSFRTEIAIPESPFKIDHATKMVSIGSCFTENIGQKLADLKFDIDQNPFGILYNPFSMLQGLRRLLAAHPYTADELFQQDGLWHSWDHHSRFSHTDKETTLLQINERLTVSADQLKNADVLLLTFGTAWVFHHLVADRVVANCHKVGSASFRRYRLHVPDMVEAYLPVMDQLLMDYPDRKIVLTVSPVRHLKDGLVENQMSKSTLVQFVHDLTDRYPNASYFPSYEIMMDDLRDYRFYQADMVHPNEVAVDYIWERFDETYFTDATRNLNRKIQKLNAAMEHRPFNPDTAEHKAFRKVQKEKIKSLQQRHPEIDWKRELDYFSSHSNQ